MTRRRGQPRHYKQNETMQATAAPTACFRRSNSFVYLERLALAGSVGVFVRWLLLAPKASARCLGPEIRIRKVRQIGRSMCRTDLDNLRWQCSHLFCLHRVLLSAHDEPLLHSLYFPFPFYFNSSPPTVIITSTFCARRHKSC